MAAEIILLLVAAALIGGAGFLIGEAYQQDRSRYTVGPDIQAIVMDLERGIRMMRWNLDTYGLLNCQKAGFSACNFDICPDREACARGGLKSKPFRRS